MGLFRNAMASIGIGSAKVDTILDNDRVQVGSPVTGRISLKGGKIEQKIDNIYLEVRTEYKQESEDDDDEYTLTDTVQKITIPIGQAIAPKQQANIPFQFILSSEVPITMGKTKVWIHTGLDIKRAIDPTDKDYIEVLPHPYMQVVLNAFQILGFQIREVENESVNSTSEKEFVQEFEFVPKSGMFKGYLDELEVVFAIYNDGIKLWLEIDRKARGLKGLFAEVFDMDETKTNLGIYVQDLQKGPEYIAENLGEFIQSYLK
ncbi:MAG: sporulation protein [Marinisporobacter sp.]|nr:sporulation protein [Marinisporobacter sp.]